MNRIAIAEAIPKTRQGTLQHFDVAAFADGFPIGY